MKVNYIAFLLAVIFCTYTSRAQEYDLSGAWTVELDSANIGMENNYAGKLYSTPINLPGTTDLAKLGTKNVLAPQLTKPQLSHLTRSYSYVGPAWYSRKIKVPKNWTGKRIVLYLERVLWSSRVWVDGQAVSGVEESLTTPHRHDLTQYLHPGEEQILTVRIDNSYLHDISVSDNLAHSYTNHTQIKWNGILGKIELQAIDSQSIDAINVYPDITAQRVKAKLSIANQGVGTVNSELLVSIQSVSSGKTVFQSKYKRKIVPGENAVDVACPISDAKLWSELSPELYELKVELKAGKSRSSMSTTFGMREIEQQNGKIMVNRKPVFMRGTLECCIFPLTGTPPTDKAGWEKVFKTAKAYGLNHLRFHSWCPPKAAFDVADELGFYLQVELPLWSTSFGGNSDDVKFIQDEAHRILDEYGNHPSFCMLSMGNELEGNFQIFSDLVKSLKSEDSRRLYTTTTFTFQKGHGVGPEPNDDYFITQWTNDGWVRGQGVFNQYAPSFDKDYASALKNIDIPLITHEIGQYAVYPDLREIPKYTGVLEPLNYVAIKNDLESKGLLQNAERYTLASGKLAAILYKEEIERALKTAGVSGFQLLDLHDFPGQGTATVGLLNAFWESKGILTDSQFREFCSPIVPLISYPKAVYSDNENFVATVSIANYGDKGLNNTCLTWKIVDGDAVIYDGTIDANQLGIGYNSGLGVIDIPLKAITKATKLQVVVSIDDTEIRNSWNIWVYPKSAHLNWGDVAFTRDFSEAKTLLQQGKKVLLNPDWTKINGVEGKFVPVFWSPVHFPKQAGTMGVLCNPAHPALADFPTDFHSDWQWWDLNINSTTMIVDEVKGGRPIVEMVDNFVNNRRLALVYEGRVGAGKLIISSIDLTTGLDNRPVAKQLLKSLLDYMNGKAFEPSEITNLDVLSSSFESGNSKKESAKIFMNDNVKR